MPQPVIICDGTVAEELIDRADREPKCVCPVLAMPQDMTSRVRSATEEMFIWTGIGGIIGFFAHSIWTVLH